jgi:DNA-binding MarR family transcriptional regulator
LVESNNRSRRPLIAAPRTSSDAPSEYTSALSKSVTPASRLMWTSRRPSRASVVPQAPNNGPLPPKVPAPKLSAETWRVHGARRDGPAAEGHLRMHEVATVATLSGSAATRLVNRLETRALIARVLCDDDRRGIYSALTPAGKGLLAQARPTHDATLKSTLERAASEPDLAPLVAALLVPQSV